MGTPVNLISSSLRPKNYLINSGFSIWQRFGSTNSANGTVASVFYHADRWAFLSNAVSNYSLSRQAHSNPFSNARHAIRVQRNSGNTSVGAYQMSQTVERIDSERLRGKTVTLSFSARRGANFSSVGNLLRAEIVTTVLNPDTNYLSGWSTPTILQSDVVLNTTMTRYFFTVTLANDISNVAVNLRYVPSGTAGADDWFQAEDIQLEEGSAATAWELRGSSLVVEVLLCQRFYEKSYNFNTTPGAATASGTTGVRGINGSPYHYTPFAVLKRVAPTIVTYDWAGAASRIRTNGANNITLNGSIDNQTGSFMVAHNTTSNEIFFHWTADAEL